MQTFMIDRKCGPKNFPNEAEASYPPYLILFLLFLILLLPLSLLKEDRLVFWPGMFLREKQDQHFHFDSGQSWIHVESFWSRWFVQFQCLVSRQLNVIWPGKRCHAGLSVLNDLTYISCQALVFIWIHSQLFMCIFKSNKCLHVWIALCARMSVCVHFYCSYLVLKLICRRFQCSRKRTAAQTQKKNDIQFDESLVASHMWNLQKTI